MNAIAFFLVVSLFFGGIFLGCQSVFPSPSLRVENAVKSPSESAKSMLETLWKTCKFLSQDPLTAQETATYLGQILRDLEGNSAIEVKPSNPAFQSARVVRQAGTNAPAHVELILAAASQLTIAELKARFGDYQIPPKVHWQSPTKAIFQLDFPDFPRTCALIAEIEPGEQGVPDGTVKVITLRRDIRLP